MKTMVVAAADRTLIRSFPGIVQASKMADLGFQVPGVLINLPFREGERASKGKVIAQLRNDEFLARVQTMQSSLDQAVAFDINWCRVSELFGVVFQDYLA